MRAGTALVRVSPPGSAGGMGVVCAAIPGTVMPRATASVHNAVRPPLRMADNFKRRLQRAKPDRTKMVRIEVRIKGNFGEKKATGPNTWLRALLPPVCTVFSRPCGRYLLLDDSDCAAFLATAGTVGIDIPRAFLA